MSVIEDSRKVIQDFLAPELRAIAVRLDALEKRFDGKFDDVNRRLDDVERRSEKRHEEVLTSIAKASEISAIRERLARLESQTAPHR